MEIALLAQRADVIPVLAAWFKAEWPGYYAERTAAEIGQDFQSWLNRRDLPIGLVAHDGGAPVGTIVLREHPMDEVTQYRPALGALYVAASHRRRGVGTELVRAGMRLAKDLGHDAVYAASARAGGMFERLGWVNIGVIHRAEPNAIYRYALQ